jgi:holo-[acyl-carrier protein] synthase
MIIGLGMDLVEIAAFGENIRSEAFLRKVFTEAEIRECRSMANSTERFAGRFAAKEACMKALGHGIRQEVWFTQIEVMNDANGAPYVQVSGEAERVLNAKGAKRIHVSITHTKNTAGAVVILED